MRGAPANTNISVEIVVMVIVVPLRKRQLVRQRAAEISECCAQCAWQGRMCVVTASRRSHSSSRSNLWSKCSDELCWLLLSLVRQI